MKQIKPIFVSEKQLHAIETWFNDVTEDMLYGGAARGGKSETIGIILAICIAAFPGSNWLISRTQLADLKATTLATFFDVLKRFNYGSNSYRDRIRDERHIEFVNNSKLFVIQVNLEPSDPEFDRIGSYGYTGGFLDEGQQMSNKVREVLQGRLSELNGSFSSEVGDEYADIPDDQIKPCNEIEFYVVDKVLRINARQEAEEKINEFQKIIDGVKKGITHYDNGSLIEIDKVHANIDEAKDDLADIIETQGKEYLEIITDNGRKHYISRRASLKIPYEFISSEQKDGKTIHTYGWNFKGCIFTGCNPGTNFTRSEFYKPWKEKKLPPYMSFIPAKVNDNPWVERGYVRRLERLPEDNTRKQRLLYGNFDYDDSDDILYDQQTIEKMFTRKQTPSDIRYTVVDASRMGKDKTEVGVWEGLDLIHIEHIAKGKLTDQAEKILGINKKYGVNTQDNCIVDEVGVGGGLVDLLGCIGFVGNSQALQPFESKFLSWKKRNYMNLRTQSFYYLQTYMENISITCNPDTQQEIIEELLVIKEKNVLDETKLQIIKKSEMISELGRSPDKADMIGMRMWWMINDHHQGNTPKEDLMENTVHTDNFLDGLISEMSKQDQANQNNNFAPDLGIYD